MTHAGILSWPLIFASRDTINEVIIFFQDRFTASLPCHQGEHAIDSWRLIHPQHGPVGHDWHSNFMKKKRALDPTTAAWSLARAPSHGNAKLLTIRLVPGF
jgi:hypothetical protein